MSTVTKDLNLGRQVLSHWNTALALREIIANAIDESVLNPNVQFTAEYNLGVTYITDTGSGLHLENFVNTENKEKKAKDGTIGNFGEGLKCAIGYLCSNGKNVVIRSLSSTYSFRYITSQEGITTLHVDCRYTLPKIQGTEVAVYGTNQQDLEQAKMCFVYWRRFHDLQHIETNKHGEVYLSTSGYSSIFVNGMHIMSNKRKLFSYNITKTTDKIVNELTRDKGFNTKPSLFDSKITTILNNCASSVFINVAANNYDRFKELSPVHSTIKSRIQERRNTQRQCQLTNSEQESLAACVSDASRFIQRWSLNNITVNATGATEPETIGDTIYVPRCVLNNRQDVTRLLCFEAYRITKRKSTLSKEVRELLEMLVNDL